MVVGLGDALGRLLDELVGPDLEAIAALAGVALEFSLDPLGRCIDAVVLHAGHSGGKCLARVEGDECLDIALDLRSGDFFQRGGDLRIDRRGRGLGRLLRLGGNRKHPSRQHKPRFRSEFSFCMS